MGADHSCKVDRVVAAYDLADADPRHGSIDEGLLARWRGDGDHEAVGYRTLAAWFNRRLLRRASRDAGRTTPASRLEYEYEALTGEDDLAREEVSERLRADGVDVEGVRSAFVSWGSLRTHLLECLDGEKPPQEAGDWERDSIEVARSVVREKVETALSSLGSTGDLAGVDRTAVDVDIQLQCTACPTRAPLEIALDRGYVCAEHAEVDP
ncbi:MAG: hypothetical protein V5A43_07995 [Haloarculaceae archaeon]